VGAIRVGSDIKVSFERFEGVKQGVLPEKGVSVVNRNQSLNQIPLTVKSSTQPMESFENFRFWLNPRRRAATPRSHRCDRGLSCPTPENQRCDHR